MSKGWRVWLRLHTTSRQCFIYSGSGETHYFSMRPVCRLQRNSSVWTCSRSFWCSSIRTSGLYRMRFSDSFLCFSIITRVTNDHSTGQKPAFKIIQFFFTFKLWTTEILKSWLTGGPTLLSAKSRTKVESPEGGRRRPSESCNQLQFVL